MGTYLLVAVLRTCLFIALKAGEKQAEMLLVLLLWCISQTKAEEEPSAALEEGQRGCVEAEGKPTEKVSQESCPQLTWPVKHHKGVASHCLCKYKSQNTAHTEVSKTFPES